MLSNLYKQLYRNLSTNPSRNFSIKSNPKSTALVSTNGPAALVPIDNKEFYDKINQELTTALQQTQKENDDFRREANKRYRRLGYGVLAVGLVSYAIYDIHEGDNIFSFLIKNHQAITGLTSSEVYMNIFKTCYNNRTYRFAWDDDMFKILLPLAIQHNNTSVIYFLLDKVTKEQLDKYGAGRLIMQEAAAYCNLGVVKYVYPHASRYFHDILLDYINRNFWGVNNNNFEILEYVANNKPPGTYINNIEQYIIQRVMWDLNLDLLLLLIEKYDVNIIRNVGIRFYDNYIAWLEGDYNADPRSSKASKQLAMLTYLNEHITGEYNLKFFTK